MFRDFIKYLPPRLKEYDRTVMHNRIFQARTMGIGGLTVKEAIEWGMTGPNLRACGFDWDFRKRQPYSGYDQFQFEIPTAKNGDCYDRAVVRVEEMRQSLRIIEQCMKNMPEGAYQFGAPIGHATGEGAHHARYRNLDYSLPERELGAGDAGG